MDRTMSNDSWIKIVVSVMAVVPLAYLLQKSSHRIDANMQEVLGYLVYGVAGVCFALLMSVLLKRGRDSNQSKKAGGERGKARVQVHH